MRPDAQQTPQEKETGRIIYLGDVRRRRRARRRQAPDRHYLAVIALVAAACWLVWGTVLFSLSPSRLLTYLAFFAPLFAALAATGTLIAYAVEWRLGRYPALGAAGRRGLLLAGVVVINLAVQAAHIWVLPVGLGTAGLALGLETLMEARGQY
jgi:hypothetical protein